MTEAVLPLSTEWQQQLDQFSATQLAWLSGYCWARSQNGQAAAVGSAGASANTVSAAPAAVPAAEPERLHRGAILEPSEGPGPGHGCRRLLPSAAIRPRAA